MRSGSRAYSVLDHATGLTVVSFSTWCRFVRQLVLHHEARFAPDHARVRSWTHLKDHALLMIKDLPHLVS